MFMVDYKKDFVKNKREVKMKDETITHGNNDSKFISLVHHTTYCDNNESKKYCMVYILAMKKVSDNHV